MEAAKRLYQPGGKDQRARADDQPQPTHGDKKCADALQDRKQKAGPRQNLAGPVEPGLTRGGRTAPSRRLRVVFHGNPSVAESGGSRGPAVRGRCRFKPSLPEDAAI